MTENNKYLFSIFFVQVLDPASGGQKPFCSVRGSSVEVHQFGKNLEFSLFQVRAWEGVGTLLGAFHRNMKFKNNKIICIELISTDVLSKNNS